jgi:hypothetical protein
MARENSLAEVASKFTDRLDQIAEREALTTDLTINGNLVGEMTGAGVVEVAKIVMDGLADHKRGAGFTRGGITQTWDKVQLTYDRDREFVIDYLDDEERAMVLSANVMAEFERTKVVPEVDAIRFAKLAAGAGHVEAAAIADKTAALEAVLDGEEAIEANRGSLEGCILYVSPKTKRLLREATPYSFTEGDPNTNFIAYDGMKTITVPTNRFNSAVELLDGTTTGEEAGGFQAAEAAKAIDFMIVDPAAAEAIAKHVKLRYFAPDVNQSDDAHLWQYRIFHDLFVYPGKAGLIYAHTAA